MQRPGAVVSDGGQRITPDEAASWRLAPAPAPRSSPDPGSAWAQRYQLLERLGQGGGGAVYRAVDRRTGAPRAIKRLAGDGGTTRGGENPFLQEAEILSRIEHPGVVKVHDWGWVEGAPYLAMELLEGETLEARLAQERLQRGEAVALTAELLEIVEAVHLAGVIHRDLKPGNLVLLSPESAGGLRLIDFGLAVYRGTETARSSRVSGTPAYMAPERLAGHPGNFATDLYAVGAIAYELLSGRPPFGFGPEEIVENMRRSLEPAAPDDRRLSSWVAALLRQDPWLRPASASRALGRLNVLRKGKVGALAGRSWVSWAASLPFAP